MGARRSPTIGGVTLIVACFVGSAALRLTESGPALAQGLEEMTGPRLTPASMPAEPEKSSAEADALLRAIREREAQLDRHAAQLADRAQALNVAETKLAEQLEAFEKARQNLEQTLAQADKAAERDIERMTTVYENMKPEEAARIFERMEVSFAAGLLSRMRPELTADVLASMEPDSAYAVTLTIASRNARVPTE
jgi:flagellar motility protein MotE (MotC chaperone)